MAPSLTQPVFKRSTLRTHPATAALVVAVVLVFTVGKAFFDMPGLWQAEAQQLRQVRLEPLATFRTYRVWWGPWLNFFGNLALFVPVGVVAYRGSVARATLAGTVFSIAIETAQYVLAAGYSDLDDVLFNTAGAFLGACAVAAVTRRRPGAGARSARGRRGRGPARGGTRPAPPGSPGTRGRG